MTALGRRLTTFGRAPVAEWEEVAHAVRRPLALPGWLTQHAWWLLLMSHASLLVAFVVGSTNAAVIFWLLATAIDWCVTRTDAQIARLITFAGLNPQLRAALRGVVLVGALAAHNVAVGYVIAFIAIQGVWLALGAGAVMMWRSAPPLLFIPESRVQPSPLASYSRFYSLAVGIPVVLVVAEALVVVALMPALSLSSIVVHVAAGVGALVALGYGVFAATTARRAQRSTDDLVAELATARPRYLTYVSLGAGQSRYIVNQWSPVFDATEVNGLMVVREASQLAPLVSTRVPVVYAPDVRHVEQLTLPGIEVAFYLAYGEKNAHLLRNPGLKHVMLLHGDSDKQSSVNAQARGFDQVWVAGQAGIDRYREAGIDLPLDRFAVIGRPQVEPLMRGADRPVGDPPVVLYAPTFEGYYAGTSHSSLDVMGVEMVKRILTEVPQVRVWFKPHPASGVTRPAMLAAIAEIEQLLKRGDHRVVDNTDLTLVDCLSQADVLLSDISSVVSDYLVTGRPVLVTNPDGVPDDEFHERYPSQRGSYVVDPGLDGLTAALNLALGADPLKAERLSLRTYLLGDLPEGPQAAFDTALARLLRGV